MGNVIKHPAYKPKKALARFYKVVEAAATRLLADTDLELCSETRVRLVTSALADDILIYDEKEHPFE